MSTAETYTPRADTLAARVMQYFRRLPDEELSAKDIALKYNTEHGSVHTCLKAAVEHGALLRDGTVYRAGPNIGEVEAPAVTLGSAQANSVFSAATKTAASKAARPKHPAIDLNALKVEEDVPHVARTAPGCSKWEPIFIKLTKPGQSIQLPEHVKGAVAAAAAKRNKEKRGNFRVGLDGTGVVRVWRTS